MAWDVEYRKPPMLLCMGLNIRLDEDLYGSLAGVHFHSNRCVAEIYLMPTTVLPSNNRVRHVLPLSEGNSQTYLDGKTFKGLSRTRLQSPGVASIYLHSIRWRSGGVDTSTRQGDRVQLQQVVLNLIINAIEAMSGGDEGPRELVIKTAKSEPDSVSVAVQDSGPGLDPANSERAFEAFQRLN